MTYLDPRLSSKFWLHVDVTESGCWLWTGGVNNKGYGAWRDGAHRVAYRALRAATDPIRMGMCLDHVCGTKRCVNPEHLEQVTYAENLRRAYQRGERVGRRNAGCIPDARDRPQRWQR